MNFTDWAFERRINKRGVKTVLVSEQKYTVNGLTYKIRIAEEKDAADLSALRLQIDGEKEHMDREQGEGFIDEGGFRDLIENDSRLPRNLFLVAETEGTIVVFARCEGVYLKRSAHKVQFGVCVAKDYWGHGIGKQLLTIASLSVVHIANPWCAMQRVNGSVVAKGLTTM